MIERVDHHVLLHHDSDAPEGGGEPGLEDETEVVEEDGRAPLREVTRQHVALAGEIGCARVDIQHRRAVGWNRGQGRRGDLPGLVAQGLEGASQPSGPVESHLDDRGSSLSVAVTRHTLEMGVELEVLHRVLVVALDEADRGGVLAGDPENPEGDLVLVRAHHLDPAAVGLEHGRVVDPHAVGVGHRRLLVGIDGAHVEMGVSTPEDFHHVLRAQALLVLRLIEVGELHVPAEPIDDVPGLLRGREDPLTGKIEVRVVQNEGDIGQGCEAERRGHDADHVAEGRKPSQARLQGKAKTQHEEHGEGREPPREPDRVDDVEAVHRHPTAAPALARSGRRPRGPR